MTTGYQPRIASGDKSRFTAALRVHHPSLDPRLIASALGLRPRISRRVGERRRTPKGGLLPGYAEESFCCFTVIDRVASGVEFLTAIDTFLDRLTPAKQFLGDVRAGGGGADLFVGWFFEVFASLVVEHRWLAKLGNLEIDLSLDIYGGDGPIGT